MSKRKEIFFVIVFISLFFLIICKNNILTNFLSKFPRMGVKGLARFMKDHGGGHCVNLTHLSEEIARKEREEGGKEEGLKVVVDGSALLFWLLQHGTECIDSFC